MSSLPWRTSAHCRVYVGIGCFMKSGIEPNNRKHPRCWELSTRARSARSKCGKWNCSGSVRLLQELNDFLHSCAIVVVQLTTVTTVMVLIPRTSWIEWNCDHYWTCIELGNFLERLCLCHCSVSSMALSLPVHWFSVTFAIRRPELIHRQFQKQFDLAT